jgi:hypothetical protein
MSPAPESIEPQRIEVRMMPKGLARASSAMAMASNPMPTNTPGLRNPDVPVISPAPASPAKAPEKIITRMIVRFTPMPAYFAALGFVPTVRTSKPNVVRRRMNHTSAHSPTARKNPRCTGGLVWITSGRRADSGRVPVRGTEAVVSRRMTGSCEFTSQRT